jgi:hypothetical protein
MSEVRAGAGRARANGVHAMGEVRVSAAEPDGRGARP